MALSLWPTLQCCFTALTVVSSYSSSKIPPGDVNQVEVLTLDHRSTLILFFFSHSLADLLLCLGS